MRNFQETENKRRKGCYKRRRKICSFCKDGIEEVDYKDFASLEEFISERAKILPRRATGACAGHQRALAVAIKRLRHLAVLPYVSN